MSSYKLKAFLVLFFFAALMSKTEMAYAQKNKTCRITARLSTAFFMDLKEKKCKANSNFCNEIILTAQEEFGVNLKWNGVRTGIYNLCTWKLKGKDLTYTVPANLLRSVLNDMKASGYFSSIKEQ